MDLFSVKSTFAVEPEEDFSPVVEIVDNKTGQILRMSPQEALGLSTEINNALICAGTTLVAASVFYQEPQIRKGFAKKKPKSVNVVEKVIQSLQLPDRAKFSIAFEEDDSPSNFLLKFTIGEREYIEKSSDLLDFSGILAKVAIDCMAKIIAKKEVSRTVFR